MESFEKTLAQVSSFHIILALCYVALLVWFYQLMRQFKSFRILLEECIMVVIVLGFFENVLHAMQFHAYINPGEGPDFLQCFAGILGAAKQALGKCMLLMLSLGLGVARDSLPGKTLMAVLGLSALPFCCAVSFHVLFLYADYDSNNHQGLYSAMTALAGLDAVIEVVSMIWIPLALCSTMKYLKTHDQHGTKKLARYRTLLRIVVGGTCLFFLTLFLAIYIKAIPGWGYMEINQANFFIILVVVAVLWKPNPHARDYAYVSTMDLTDAGDNDYSIMDLTDGGDNENNNHSGGGHAGNGGSGQSSLYMELTDSTPDHTAEMLFSQPAQQQQQSQQMQQQQTQLQFS